MAASGHGRAGMTIRGQNALLAAAIVVAGLMAGELVSRQLWRRGPAGVSPESFQGTRPAHSRAQDKSEPAPLEPFPTLAPPPALSTSESHGGGFRTSDNFAPMERLPRVDESQVDPVIETLPPTPAASTTHTPSMGEAAGDEAGLFPPLAPPLSTLDHTPESPLSMPALPAPPPERHLARPSIVTRLRPAEGNSAPVEVQQPSLAGPWGDSAAEDAAPAFGPVVHEDDNMAASRRTLDRESLAGEEREQLGAELELATDRWLHERPLDERERAAAAAGMDEVESRAYDLVVSGFDAAQRGATFTAKRRFLAALRLIVQAADMGCGRSVHESHLSDALRAVDEADDFARLDRLGDEKLDLANIVGGHRSHIVSVEEASRMPLIAIQQRYYEFAQTHLIAATAGSRSASLALYGLGKFHNELAQRTPESLQRHGPSAVACFQSSLAVDDGNHLAANELGVLFARYGRLDDAREHLLHSLRTEQSTEAWHNLAVVHERLGETTLAAQARRAGELAGARESAGHDPLNGREIQWLDPDAFVRSTQPPNALDAARPRTQR